MPGSFESIATVNVTSSISSISFTSIPGTYQHLQLRIFARTSLNNGDTDFINLRFNGDTAANYGTTEIYAQDARYTAQDVNKSTAHPAILVQRLATAVLSANVFMIGYIDIPDYAVTGKKRSASWQTGFITRAQQINNSWWSEMGSGMWNNSSAVTTINMTTAYGANFAVDSHFALYGIKSS